MPGYFYDTNPLGLPEIGSLNPDGSGSGFLGTIPYGPNVINNISKILPFSVSFDTEHAMMTNISAMKAQLINARRDSFDIKQFQKLLLPMCSLNFQEFSVDQRALNYTIAIETQDIFRFRNISDPSIYIFSMNVLQSAFLQYVMSIDITIYSGGWELPYLQTPPSFDIGSLLGGLFFPFSLSFLLPLFVFSIVLEKEKRLRDMCLMMGLRMRNYWIVTYIFNYLLYFCALFIVVGVGMMFGFSVFLRSSWFAMFLLLFGWGHSMITFSFFLSTIFSRTRTATISCYFLVIISVIVNLVLGYQVFQNSSPPAPYYWYPPFAFYRGLSLISVLCGLDQCPKWSDFDWDFEPSRCILWIYVDTVFFLLLSLYLDQVLPREYGVPSHPLFFLDPIIDRFKRKGKSAHELQLDEQSLLINENDVEELDSDVRAERDRIKSRSHNPHAPIIIENLSKHYPKRPKPALDGLFLSIETGECFGFLGPNGAGKTTTISLLTGLYKPSSGTARVGGLDIRHQMDYIHRIIGVCPQFDTLWEDLSCVETLLFYARLKGIPKDGEIQNVERALQDVNLFNVKDKLVKELSGGMKRRLSVAVSIIGNSQIIFLDEPTTGLDPVTRRELWVILNNLKKDRCLILTTHSLEEADVLSTRIGIISQGKLQCLGPQQHLKMKFGEGYTLKMNVDPDYLNQINPTNLIQEFNRDAKLVESFAGSFVFRLPKDILVSDLFSFMSINQSPNHITEFGVMQTSLEDVFLKIASTDETVN
eukprot:gene3972-4968_t